MCDRAWKSDIVELLLWKITRECFKSSLMRPTSMQRVCFGVVVLLSVAFQCVGQFCLNNGSSKFTPCHANNCSVTSAIHLPGVVLPGLVGQFEGCHSTTSATLTNSSISYSINHSINHSLNHLLNQWIKHSFNQSHINALYIFIVTGNLPTFLTTLVECTDRQLPANDTLHRREIVSSNLCPG